MRARHVIIEGPDATGKTTLARALCEVEGYAYRHEGPPPPGVTVFQHYAGILERLDRPTLLDRFHLGELVYGPLLRGGSGLAPVHMTALRAMLDQLRVQVILCLPPFSVAWRTWYDRHQAGQEFLAEPDLFCASYLGFSNLRGEADVIYDYTRDRVDTALLTFLRRGKCLRAAS